MALKLISLNIERSKHLEKVLPFLDREEPDVLCVQELMDRDIPKFEASVGQGAFAPMSYQSGENPPGIIGVGIFSRYPMQTEKRYYWGNGSTDAPFDMSSRDTKHATESHVALLARLSLDSTFNVATTHFTWTPDGSADELQRRDLRSLLAVLEGEELVLCGDFNAPRGGEIFEMLARRYTDTIPPHYKTTIDIALHRAGKERPEELADKMVDGLFTTPAYRAQDVVLVNGVSDHMAIVATIEKGTALA